jgi:hypothetical protein
MHRLTELRKMDKEKLVSLMRKTELELLRYKKEYKSLRRQLHKPTP